MSSQLSIGVDYLKVKDHQSKEQSQGKDQESLVDEHKKGQGINQVVVLSYGNMRMDLGQRRIIFLTKYKNENVKPALTHQRLRAVHKCYHLRHPKFPVTLRSRIGQGKPWNNDLIIGIQYFN